MMDASDRLHQRGLLALCMKRPIGVSMSLLLMVVLGVIAYRGLRLQLLPDDLSPPFMFVSIPTLAASPEENELTIAKPVEDALSTLAEVDELKSFIRTSHVGFAIL